MQRVQPRAGLYRHCDGVSVRRASGGAARQVNLVIDHTAVPVGIRQGRRRGLPRRVVHHQQLQIGLPCRVLGAAHAFRLNTARRLAQPGGVGQMQRQAVNLNPLLQRVTRGTGLGMHNRARRGAQVIEQTGLTRIRQPHQHHRKAIPEQLPPARLAEQRPHPLRKPPQPFGHRVLVFGRLIGEVQHHLGMHAQFGQFIRQRPDAFRERAGQCIGGGAHCRLGRPVNQIRHRLRLRQIHPPVQKCPLAKLPGQRQPRPQRAAPLKQRPQQHRPAMRMQLHHILPGRTGRPHKTNHQPLIQHPPIRRQKPPQPRHPRRRQSPNQWPHHLKHPPPGQPHQPNRPPPRRGGDGDDCLAGRGF